MISAQISKLFLFVSSRLQYGDCLVICSPDVALREIDNANHDFVRFEAGSLEVATDSKRFVRITHSCIQDDARYENRYTPVRRAIMAGPGR